MPGKGPQWALGQGNRVVMVWAAVKWHWSRACNVHVGIRREQHRGPGTSSEPWRGGGVLQDGRVESLPPPCCGHGGGAHLTRTAQVSFIGQHDCQLCHFSHPVGFLGILGEALRSPCPSGFRNVPLFQKSAWTLGLAGSWDTTWGWRMQLQVHVSGATRCTCAERKERPRALSKHAQCILL